MSRLPPIPDPLDCVLFDAGDTLLAPAPSFQGRFVAVAAEHGLPLEEAAVDAAIAAAVRVGPATVERTRQKFVEGGVDWALRERPRPGGQRKLDGKREAFLVATACSTPPDGRERWTMQLLADRLVEVQLVDSISDETVRRTLQKTRPSRG